MPVFLLSDNISFPPPHFARKDGLLAMGGDLSRERLLLAYRKGIFPWYSNGEPILWWSPDPRLVLYPEELRVSRSLKKTIRKDRFQITMDKAFLAVIQSCADIRVNKKQPTWIVPEMIKAYCQLHESGYAHSVEAWYQGKLAGGLYGLALGKCFSGESMFARVTDASKTAFVYLVIFLKNLGFQMIDCQVKTSHLMSFGAREVPRKIYLQQLENTLDFSYARGKWNLNTNLIRELILTEIKTGGVFHEK
jgi:leucyl/phenylalanyl-tRNA---protein transferase